MRVFWSRAAARDRDDIFTFIGEESPHASYRLVHEVREDAVWILALVHTARRWPPLPER